MYGIKLNLDLEIKFMRHISYIVLKHNPLFKFLIIQLNIKKIKILIFIKVKVYIYI